jgi:protein SCO1/2
VTIESTTTSTGRLFPVLFALAISAAAAGAWFGMSVFDKGAEPAPELATGTLLPSPRPLAPFSLTNQDGATMTADSLRGHWTFVAFGFTSCPDVCPTTMANLAALSDRLAEREAAAEFLFVSVDPERNTPEGIGQYVRYFNPSFLGATGTHEELRGLTGQLGVLYARAPEQDTAMGYLVDHSASILLLDPQVRLAAVFSGPHRPDAMAQDLEAITAWASGR